MIDVIIHLLVLGPLRSEHQEELFRELSVEDVRVELREILLRSNPVLICFVDLHKLIGIVDLVLEQHKRRQLPGEVLADAHDIQLGI